MLECKALVVEKCIQHGRCVFSSPHHMTRLLGIEDEISGDVLFEWEASHMFLTISSQDLHHVGDSADHASAGQSSYWGVLKSSMRWTVEQAVAWSCWLGKGFHKATLGRLMKRQRENTAEQEAQAGEVADTETADSPAEDTSVLFVPALHRMCSILLDELGEFSPYNNIWTLEDWTDFVLDHKLRNGYVITNQLIQNGALHVVPATRREGDGGEAIVVSGIGSLKDVSAIVDWKVMVERLDGQVRTWEGELQELVDLQEASTDSATRLRQLIEGNKLVHIQTQKLHRQLQHAKKGSPAFDSLQAAVERIDEMMEQFPGDWPMCSETGENDTHATR